MEEALVRWEKESEKTAEKNVILDYLSFSYSHFGSLRKALNLTNDWLAIEPGHERAIANRRYYERIIAEADDAERQKLKGDNGAPVVDGKPHRFLTDYTGSKSYSDYEKLCRGEETHKRPFKHRLVCRYQRYHPIFYISPLKEEMLNFDPAIYVYHDVLTDSQNAIIKEVSRPKLHRSGVFSKTDADTGLSNFRTSQTAWHDDSTHPLIARLSQKASAISNLTLETVEHLQVLNYGIGGLYEPHWDFVQGEERNEFSESDRNRVATFICYLSELEAGGYTVYPTVGAAVVPRKNSCALWYNLMRNGTGDYRTYHAACPILYGYKWVANKWFHEGGQEFVRPCGLNSAE
ncbi:hypothetical protein CAPTEDRAFT_162820 [Capitella teleta]|nr:hypothetical protein CAPTEDRAFT_162820 [Capitella teleta]|eukprot:ELT98193.1 hypothetical protein CAPTEDRAFT_162820 [Capitella teleta]